MTPDPRPEFRCRCVHRTVHLPDLGHLLSPADPYYDRCRSRPTEEDGLCDHCRGGVQPLSDESWQRVGECVTCGPDWRCCLHPSQRRQIVDLMTPCMDVSPAEVPF